MENMFCFQCEQTANSTGCTLSGVCGKKPATANLQDRLVGALIDLAVSGKQSDEITEMLVDGLFATITNVNFDDASLKKLVEKARTLSGKCCAGGSDFDTSSIWRTAPEIRSLKSLILFGLKGTAAYAHHAEVLGISDAAVDAFFYEALRALAKADSQTELLPLVMKTGEINLKCMAALDRANTAAYGDPVPTRVSTEIEKGAFIVVSGHDLRDLELLLKQTQGRGVNVYTHGEMLPCHAYPRLKKYPHLKGNFGTAWQNQQREFAAIPAAILFTTNCIMPVQKSYKDRVFTTSVVYYPETVHIGEDKNFEPVIQKALELGGYPERRKMTGINGGNVLTTGFGHAAVMSVADKLIAAIKARKISHIYLVGGCDGAKPGRNYYTQFVRDLPKDTIVLTLACGKYRFNDLDLGEIDGIPRLLDMGQCNDAYSAIVVADALADAFGCSINELPLSFVLSWYEQKAVCVLLTLLYLGIKNIKLGPTMPAFITPELLNSLPIQKIL